MVTAAALLLLLGATRWIWPPTHDSEYLLERAVHLDVSGKQSLATVRSAAFSPPPSALAAILHRDPPGAVRWERLKLQPREATETEQRVLHIQVPRHAWVQVGYATPPRGCQSPATMTTIPADLELSLTRWFDIPLCDGPLTLYVGTPVTRDHGAITEVLSAREAHEHSFITTANAYSIAMLSGATAIIACGLLFGPLFAPAAGMLGHIVLSMPFLLYHAAIPTHAAASPLITGYLPPDTLLALTLLAKAFMLYGLFPTTQRDRPGSTLLLMLFGTSALAVLLTLATPFPWGYRMTLVAAGCSLVTAVGLILTSFPRAEAAELPAAAHSNLLEETTVIALALASVWTGWKLLDWNDWQHYPFHSLAVLLLFALLVQLRSNRHARAAAATLAVERLARQQAEALADQERRQQRDTRDLLLMLTHELRTPLGVLRFSLDAAGHMPAARQRAEVAIQSMDALVERCLQAAHLEDDAKAEVPERWAPGQEIPSLVQQTHAPERIQVQIEPAAPAPMTRPGVVGLIVSVLLDNALKYGSTQHEVRLQAFPEERDGVPGLLIAVDNHQGKAGLPDPDRLFQKYYRSPGAHQHTGAGLGLFLSARLAKRLGGQLRYQPLTNLTRFQLWLPT